MNPVNNTAIPIKDINSVPQVFTPTSTVNPFDYTSPINQVQTDIFGGVQNAQNQVNQLTEQAKQKSSSIATLESLLGNKAQDTTNLYDTTGVTNLYNQLSDLNAQATGLKNEAAAIPIQVQQQALGQGVTDRGIAPIETAKLRDNALKALSLGQQYAIVSGNYDKARNYADQLITAKYSQIEANINARKTDLAALEKYDLTPAQTKLLNAQNAAIKKQEQEMADKKANDKAISDMIINASSANAPRDLVSKAQAAKTPSEAAMILGQYAGDYYKTELLKNQIATEKAQRAKYYADIENSKKELAVKLGITPVAASGKIEASQSTYNLANELLTLAGKGGAVGAGIGKALGAVLPGYDGTAFAGTDRANYEAKVAQLKDTLASANLDKLKGAMSDKDIEFLRNIGTALNPSMSETAFDAELEKIKNTMLKVPGVRGVETTSSTNNPFSQALSGENQTIPGASIVNSIGSDGNINFNIPK